MLNIFHKIISFIVFFIIIIIFIIIFHIFKNVGLLFIMTFIIHYDSCKIGLRLLSWLETEYFTRFVYEHLERYNPIAVGIRQWKLTYSRQINPTIRQEIRTVIAVYVSLAHRLSPLHTYLRSNWYTTGQWFQIQAIYIRVKILVLIPSFYTRFLEITAF